MNSSSENSQRPRYDESFKIEALRLWKTGRRSAGDVARELGISPATLYTWGREARPIGQDSPVGGTLVREMKQEICRLREENERLRQQREVLKKTLAILSESHRNGADSGKARNGELAAFPPQKA